MSTSPPVTWDSLALNLDAERDDGVLPVVESVTGWYDTPDYSGNDTALVLADGSVPGPKTAAARVITISGSVVGPPPALATFRDQLVMRASSLQFADLTIPDAAGRSMTASVRCDSDGLKHTFNGPTLFAYQAVLTAVDPRLYGPASSATLLAAGSSAAGWRYDQASNWSVTVAAPAAPDPYPWAETVLVLRPAGSRAQQLYVFGYNVYTGSGTPAPSVIQQIPANWGNILQAGDLGVVPVGGDFPAGFTVTVTDSQGNPWAQAGPPISTPDGLKQVFFTSPIAKTLGASDTVTVTCTPGAPTGIIATAYGVTGATFDHIVNASGTSTAATTIVPLTGPSAVLLVVPLTTAYPGVGTLPPGVAMDGKNFGFGWSQVMGLMPVANIRVYQRTYSPALLPNSAILVNTGNVPAPVTAVYSGDLSQSRLVDTATGNTIYFAAVAGGAEIALDTSTLNAWADGGASRAAYVLPGSARLLVPPLSSTAWELYASGSGSVTLEWSSAWH